MASVCAPQWKVGDFPAAGAANALCACAGKRPSFLCASTTNLLWWTHARGGAPSPCAPFIPSVGARSTRGASRFEWRLLLCRQSRILWQPVQYSDQSSTTGPLLSQASGPTTGPMAGALCVCVPVPLAHLTQVTPYLIYCVA